METILKLDNITKTYIMGENKAAKKALKAVHKLHHNYEQACAAGKTEIKELEKKLVAAQKYFAEDKYPESYHAATGKVLHIRKPAKGIVVHALRGIDLAIKPGELVAIVGPSGSGKSTLLNMLGLLDEPTSGAIHIRGENITKIKASKLPEVRASELGFVFQSFNLIPTLTALENVMLPLKYSKVPLGERKARAVAALASVGLSDRTGHTPNELSGGQKQRVAIARSLVNKPAIIFGDELTGELDTKMTKEVMDLIVKLNKDGQTFIIVTHNPEVAKMCGRTITIIDGKVAK